MILTKGHRLHVYTVQHRYLTTLHTGPYKHTVKCQNGGDS